MQLGGLLIRARQLSGEWRQTLGYVVWADPFSRRSIGTAIVLGGLRSTHQLYRQHLCKGEKAKIS